MAIVVTLSTYMPLEPENDAKPDAPAARPGIAWLPRRVNPGSRLLALDSFAICTEVFVPGGPIGATAPFMGALPVAATAQQ
jgi:hypothetical protein